MYKNIEEELALTVEIRPKWGISNNYVKKKIFLINCLLHKFEHSIDNRYNLLYEIIPIRLKLFKKNKRAHLSIFSPRSQTAEYTRIILEIPFAFVF